MASWSTVGSAFHSLFSCGDHGCIVWRRQTGCSSFARNLAVFLLIVGSLRVWFERGRPTGGRFGEEFLTSAPSLLVCCEESCSSEQNERLSENLPSRRKFVIWNKPKETELLRLHHVTPKSDSRSWTSGFRESRLRMPTLFQELHDLRHSSNEHGAGPTRCWTLLSCALSDLPYELPHTCCSVRAGVKSEDGFYVKRERGKRARPNVDGLENVLVVTDVFSKYTMAVPTRDQRAFTVEQVLVNEWFAKFGVPGRIHSDQGRNFESLLIQQLCHLYGIRKAAALSRTCPSRRKFVIWNKLKETELLRLHHCDPKVRVKKLETSESPG
ncbi:hypothetical protein WMY93_009868 [Mugilogobius chulae]|uniref:Integrase catalytic domain-containing protein n=1 Tax=Mugilogobius chulae TaxID=88201 RepID=A0AAW0P9H7_9GOBI